MKAGAVITCPECLTPQLKSTRDVLPGGQIKDACFESLGFDMTGLRMGCFSCGTNWSRSHPKTGKTQIHTEQDGWISLEPKPEPPKRSFLME